MIAFFYIHLFFQTISYEVIHVSGEVYIGPDSVKVTENMRVTDIDEFIFTSFESRIILIGTDAKKYFRGGKKEVYSKYESPLLSEAYDIFVPIIIPTWSKDGTAAPLGASDGGTHIYFDTLKLNFTGHEEIYYWTTTGRNSVTKAGTTFNIPSKDLTGKNSISLYSKSATSYDHLATVFIRQHDKKRVMADLREISLALKKIGLDADQIRLYQIGFLEKAYGQINLDVLEDILNQKNE